MALPDPGALSAGAITLSLRETSAAVPAKDWPPAYHFDVHAEGVAERVGRLNLRIGITETVRLYAGHVGYAIEEAHRGNRYAAQAVRAAAPLAHRMGVDPIWITCDPENVASRRVCEILGAEYVETIPVPPGTEIFERGSRMKCRYQLRALSAQPR